MKLFVKKIGTLVSCVMPNQKRAPGRANPGELMAVKINTVMNSTRATRVLLLIFLSALSAFAGQKAPTALVNLTVVRDANGKPVKNAEVVLHLINKDGKQRQEG